MKNYKRVLISFVVILLLAAIIAPASAAQNIDLDYRSTDIKDVIRSLALIANENVVVDDSAAGEVTVQLRNVSFEEALTHLLNIKNLEAKEEDGVLIIATPERIDEIYREVERKLFDLDYISPDEAQGILEELLPEINVRSLAEQNRLILLGFADQLVEAEDLLAGIDEPEEREQRVIKVNEQPPAEIAEKVEEFFPDLNIRYRSGTEDVIIQGSPRDVSEADEFIKELDVPDTEVEEIYRVQELDPEQLKEEISGLYPEEKLNIRQEDNIIFLQGEPRIISEAKEMLTELDYEEKVESRITVRTDYIDLEELEEILTDLKPNLEISTSSEERKIVMQGYEDILDRAETLVYELDQPRRQVMLEVQVEEISHTALEERGIDPGQLEDITTIGIEYREDGLPAGINFTLPDLYQFMEGEGISQTKANPRLLTLDGETAELIIGDRVPYEIVEIVEGTPQTVDYEYADVGVTLEFTPTITRDIKPEVSSITEMGEELTPPQVRTREFENTISLQDGQSFAVGGLIQDQLEETVRQFPLLGDLPILGELFTYREEDEEKTEIIIFITTEIVDLGDDVLAKENSEREPDVQETEENDEYFEEQEVDEEETKKKVKPEFDFAEDRKPLSERIGEMLEEKLQIEDKEDKKEVEKRKLTSRELSQILFQSRLQRRDNWEEEYEFAFTSSERKTEEKIAEIYRVGLERIEINSINEKFKYTLNLPAKMVYVLKENETIEDIAEKSGVPAENIRRASRIEEEEPGDIIILPYDI